MSGVEGSECKNHDDSGTRPIAVPITVALAIALASDSSSFIRTNQVGYLPDAPKIAVICSLDSASFDTFKIVDARGKRVFGPAKAVAAGSFAACRSTFRLNFT